MSPGVFEIVVFGLLAGLDNVQVCSSLGLLPIRRRRMHLLAAAFCVGEIAGALVGILIGRAVTGLLGTAAESVAPILMLACGAAVVYLAFRRDDEELERLINGRALLVGLPLSLSLDNVIAGAGISHTEAPLVAAALAIGAISATMSCLGLYLARWIRRFVPKRAELVVGVYLCFLAVRTIVTEVA